MLFKVQTGESVKQFATLFGVQDYLTSLEIGIRCIARIFSPDGKEIYL